MPDNTTINYQSEIGAGATETYKYQFSRSGTVTRLFTVAVLGEEADVLRTWTIQKDNEERPVLLTAKDGATATDAHLAGDDTVWDLPVVQPFDAGDVLELTVENTDGANPYPTIAVAEVEFDNAGASRQGAR